MWCPVPDTFPYVSINLQEVETRSETARHVIAGFSTTLPALADVWSHVRDALNDVPVLSAEINRLAAELQTARLGRANLLAAARATLAASRDGEPDPLYYLRDELAALTTPPEDTGRYA
jgi:ABC-type transporter Mla subunit MlaD